MTVKKTSIKISLEQKQIPFIPNKNKICLYDFFMTKIVNVVYENDVPVTFKSAIFRCIL